MSITQRARAPVEALAQRLNQQVESVVRNSRLFIESGNVDDIDPPDNIAEYHDHYRQIGIVRANLNKFVRDVVGPGIRIEADDPTTEAYFMGESEAADLPEFAPPGGFLKNCAVIAGEKRQPFYPYLKVDIVQKWTKGTTLNEYLKQDGTEEDPDGPITGFKHIRPETVSARTYANTNILLDPEDVETAANDEVTKRGEAAAYVQFDDNAILGPFDEREVYFSQNDILKRTLDPDIGGDGGTEDGIFGTSIIEAIADDAEEYVNIKRDRATAIKKKAYGVWSAEFDTRFVESEIAGESILEEWDAAEQDEWISEVGDLGPGDIIGHDGSIALDQWEPQVPDLDATLEHYVADILAPLPAPKYATAFGESIANHVSDRQENSYDDTIVEERRDAERDWTQAFRTVADRHPDLDPGGVRFRIEPEPEASPILSLDDDTVDRIVAYSEAVERLELASTLTDEEIRALVLQLPEQPELGEVDEQSLADLEAELGGAGE